MRVRSSPNELIIQETPGCFWLFGSLFCFVGGMFVYGSVGGFSNYDDASFWAIVLSFFMGAIAFAVGVWIIFQSPVTKVVFDRLSETVTLERYGLNGKRKSVYKFGQVKQFFLIEEKDDEDKPIWSLAMDLTSGEKVKICSMPSHSEDEKRQIVFETNQFMYKQMPSHRDVLELEDES
jgi:hypothetical protein